MERSNILLLVLCLSVAMPGTAQSVFLDPSFGNGGMTDQGLPDQDGAGVVKADPVNGGYFVYGGVRDPDGIFPMKNVLMKYTEAGQLDPAFNGGSPLNIDDLQNGLFVPPEASMTVQSDGKPVITFESPGVVLPKLRVLRFLANGQPDGQFGTDGMFELPNGIYTGIGVAQDDQGRLWCAGFGMGSIIEGEWDGIVLRLTADGALDQSFGTGGQVTFDQFDDGEDRDEQARIPVPLPGGGALIGGYHDVSDGTTRLNIFRVNDAGVVEPSFGVNGNFTTGTSTEEYITAMDLDLQGGWVNLAIRDDGNAQGGLRVDRISATTGQYVTDFGVSGSARKDFGPGIEGTTGVAHDPNGNVYACGFQIGADSSAILCRFNAMGEWDATWLVDGMDTTVTDGASFGMVYSSAGLVVAGNWSTPKDHFLAKYGPWIVHVPEVPSGPEFILAPNPTPGVFTLDLPERMSKPDIILTNALGQPILTTRLSSSQRLTIDLSPFENGVYFLEVRYTDGARAVERIIKQ